MNGDFPFGECDGCGGPLSAEGECLGPGGEFKSGSIDAAEFDQAHAAALDALREAKTFIVMTLDADGKFESTHITDRRNLPVEMAFLDRAISEVSAFSASRMQSGDYGYGFYPLYMPEDVDEMGDEG